MLKAGFNKVCISPPIGVALAGFAARKENSTGIHDDLFARALVLETSESSATLVSVDLLALPNEFIRRVRLAIQQSVGLPPESIMIASTHTHAGPVTIKTFFNPDGSVDGEYMDALASAIEEAVTNAWRSRFAARVGVGAGHVEGVGVNRRTSDQKPIDKQVGIIKVTDANSNTRAVLINYSCHPTVLGPNNLLVTGDFPAFAIQEIEADIGDDGLAMFVNGTQGNISMGHSSELSAIGVITPGRTFARAAELGHLLATATKERLPEIPVKDEVTLRVASIPVSLPLKQYPSIPETERLLREAEAQLQSLVSGNGDDVDQLRRAQSEYLYASINNFYAHETKDLADGLLAIELQAVRIDEAVFVAVPAEVFVEIGLRVKAASAHPVFIVGIANGYIGYLPTAAAYHTGGYEVVSSKCRAEAEDVLVNEILRLEQKLFAGAAEVQESRQI